MRDNTLASVPLLVDVTATKIEVWKELQGAYKVVQAWGNTSAGAGSAEVKIWVSTDKTHWVLAGTITLTLSATSELRGGDGFAVNARWKYMQAEVSAISGTDAKVSASVGC